MTFLQAVFSFTKKMGKFRKFCQLNFVENYGIIIKINFLRDDNYNESTTTKHANRVLNEKE